MGDMRRCARCGSFYTSKYEVCHECVKKDSADLSKLQGYFDEQYECGVTKSQIAKEAGWIYLTVKYITPDVICVPFTVSPDNSI